MTRIKVIWNDTRLVIPIPSSNTAPNIKRLLEEISNRFKKHTNDLDDDNYFVHLRTDDGFLLDKKDLATDVISDGDILEVVDYKTWFKKFKEENELDQWLDVTRADFVDEQPKWVQVGYASKGNQIYVEFGIGLYQAQLSKKFKVFDEDALNLLPSPSKELIDEIKGKKGTDNWYASAHFITDANGKRSVEVHVKSMSDPRPHIEVVSFDHGNLGRKYEKISTKTLQESFAPPATKVYKLTKTIVDGPVLKEEGYPIPYDPSKTIIKSTGGSCLSLQQISKMLAEQSWSYRGAFQLFSAEFRIANSSDSPVSIIQIEAEVQGSDGEWKTARAYSGVKDSDYYNMPGEHDAIITYQGQTISKIALRAKYALDYTKYRSYTNGPKRVHTSLPNPCNIRFTIKDQHSEQAQITVQAFNNGNFINRKSYEQDQRLQLYHWVQCDDVSSEERMYLPIAHKPGFTNQNVLEVWIKPSSRRPYIDAETLRKWAWLANKEGKEEYELKDWNWADDSGSFHMKFYALFDKEEKKVYGMKISMKTTTSSVIDSFLFPADIY
ncbi:hypothetical protein G9A89_002639 [Geosiphon pyriformis]|nr:hypothetical protein G9A89_002639 [Geosiphon pyriformis]